MQLVPAVFGGNSTSRVPALLPGGDPWSAAAQVVQLLQGCEVLESPSCQRQAFHVLLLLVLLSASVIAVICAFAFFREDKEEEITPLCPQLVVKEPEMTFRFPLDEPGVDKFEVVEHVSEKCVFKVAMDWPDPFRPGASGVAATVRLQNSMDCTLATVVARNVAVVGQGLALCRSGCEIFGFVEPDGPKKYQVRHRTGVHLLTLLGDFSYTNVVGINPVNAKVCWFINTGHACTGKVLQHVDAGLVICALLATRVHRRLTLSLLPPSLPSPLPPGTSWPPQPSSAAPKKLGDRSSPMMPAARIASATSEETPSEEPPVTVMTLEDERLPAESLLTPSRI